MLTQTQLKKIREILKKYPALFGYVFGSYAQNKVLLFSDLDLAIYLNPKLDKKQKNKSISELRDELEKKLKMPEKIDIVCLNEELPFLLIKNIIYGGKLLYSQNEAKRINWESNALSLWWDWQYYQKQFDEAILTRPRL